MVRKVEALLAYMTIPDPAAECQDRNLVKSLRYDSQFYKTAAAGGGDGDDDHACLAS